MSRLLRGKHRIVLALAAVVATAAFLSSAASASSRAEQRHLAGSTRAPYGMSPITYHRMLAQIPLDAAAEQIRRAAARPGAGHAGFVQIKVDADHAMLTVYWHGRVPADMQRLFAALRNRIRVAVVPARYSVAQLEQAVTQVLHSHSGLTITGPVGPLADGSGIQVGVANRIPALTGAAARRRFGTAV